MSRFVSLEKTKVIHSLTKRHPFKNIYACKENDMIYVNMEAIDELKQSMTTLRDIALIIDISGSMRKYYKDNSVNLLIKQIVDSLAWADDDGIDLYFYSKGLVYHCVVNDTNAVDDAVTRAINTKGAYSTTMPLEAFQAFCTQIKEKGRAGTVLFLTDGGMDDSGRKLKDFYKTVLHEEFKTRDNFYCYAIEFGKSAHNALNVLDGLYPPEQGPEDLFDLESAYDLAEISNVLSQIGGMSAIGSTKEVTASVDSGAKIDMVNMDLIESGMTSITGEINSVMSFRINSNSSFGLTIKMQGYDDMYLRVTPNEYEVNVQID